MHYIGIDVSTKESALCILDDKGKIVRETTDRSRDYRTPYRCHRACHRSDWLESGCTAAWRRYGWTVICIDARHAAAALQANFRNKSIVMGRAESPMSLG